MASSGASNPKTIEMDPAGDVILIVGSSEPATRLRVSSKILSLASRVFAAMFSPKFKEGSNLNPDHPTEVALPEDDVDAMTLLCNCLHFRAENKPRSKDIGVSALTGLAVVCDKYDTTKAVSPWSALWLQRWELVPGPSNKVSSEELLAAAYVLDCSESFKSISWNAIMNTEGPFEEGNIPKELDFVPTDFLVELEKEEPQYA